jgi:hypothetical protein
MYTVCTSYLKLNNCICVYKTLTQLQARFPKLFVKVLFQCAKLRLVKESPCSSAAASSRVSCGAVW